jgi:hypothetical protein
VSQQYQISTTLFEMILEDVHPRLMAVASTLQPLDDLPG